jgi:dienelactone hydrolase
MISRFVTLLLCRGDKMPALPFFRRRSVRLALAGLVVALLTAAVLSPYIRGAAFVIQAAGMQGPARRMAGWRATSVTETAVSPTPWRGGTLRSRAYQPSGRSGRGILLVPGVHAAGIDEPRLVGFARDIAAMGHPVLTVELPDLARYEITTRTTDMIEDAAGWMMQRAEYRGRDGRIGMLGISFGGGLTIVASARPAIRNGVAFAMAFGGHADLPRTLRYLCTGIQSDGAVRPPHDYGVAIVLLGAADRVVPADQVQPLRQAILAFLEASRLDMVDKAKALVEFDRAKALEAALSEPSRTYMDYVNKRDVAHLGPILLPHVAELGGDPALSPARSPSPLAPVYLLHGTGDNVVPAIESTLLARDLAARGVPVHVLLTPLITHAEVDRASTINATWRLIHFWARLLDE